MTKILCVEDNEDDVFLIKECLHNEANPDKFSVDAVDTLQGAMGYLGHEKPDLILLDLFLPDSRGMRSFEALYAHFPNVPIVIMSSLDDEQLATEAVRQGAQDYLVKGSVNPWLIGRVLRYALERHRIKIDLNEANAKLERMALNDALTGLLNRRGLEQFLSNDLPRWTREGETSSVVLIDLDNFKKINDTQGHSAGDALLTAVARKLHELLRSNDHAARVGGDEFLVVFPDTRLAEALRIAEKIRQSIEGLAVTASLGVVAIPQGDCSIDRLLVLTHDALYRSKKAGKNTVSFDGPEGEGAVHKGYLSRPSTLFIDAFRNDIRHGAFYVVKQPIHSFDLVRPIGYEFFIRSKLDDFMGLEELFRIAQEYKVLEEVDLAFFSLCATASERVKAIAHLNLFPSTLACESFRLSADKMSERQRRSICIEISEEQIVGDPTALSEAVKTIKKMGFLFALDDVRFGRSGLESLVALEPEIVKIDRKFVKGIANDPGMLRMLKRLMKITGVLKTRVIVEGIEDKKDLAALQNIGVKFGQGYELGVPA